MLLSYWTILVTYACCIAAATTKKQPYQHYSITGTHTGVNSGTGARPARRNILELLTDNPQWSLYVQGLAAMQSVPESELLSYYQIAGIHGRPYYSWDDVPQTPGAPLTGYCPHNSVLFTTWHRPYVALFEQVLCSIIQTVAQKYTGVEYQTYQNAANSFRIPFWDWATTPEMPAIVNSPTVEITTPSGVETVPNPLLQYNFQQFPMNSNYFSPTEWDGWLASYNHTVRNPDSRGENDSDFNESNGWLEQDGNLMQGTEYYSLTKSSDYDNFSTTAANGPSLEAVHNTVHAFVGGYYGHMEFLSYAAFDPIFWLHHCNVDRVFALYQAMYPNNFLTPMVEQSGTFTIPVGTEDTVLTPLEPFSTDANGDFYNSATALSLRNFGYTYPEIQDWDQTVQQLQENVTAQVNTMWGASSSLSKRGLAPGSQVIEWSVGISVSRAELNGLSFNIRIFLEHVPENPLEWPTSDNYVNSFIILSSPSVSSALSYNDIDLSNGLRAKGYDGQDVPATVSYLKEHLHWRLQLTNGTVVPTSQLSSLSVVVQQDPVTLGNSIYELPSYGKPIPYPEVTRGKQGGCKI